MTDQQKPSADGKVHETIFSKVSPALMHDLTITDGAVRLYAHMFWRYGSNGDNHEGHTSMAKFMGVSETTISNRIEELEYNDWLVVVEMERNKKSGNFRTPFYHVFLEQKDCRDFRKSYKCAEGESIHPKPTEVREKKSRKGKGGKPANILKFNETNRTNSSQSSQSNSSWDGGTNLSLSGGTNSSWRNLDTPDLDTNDSNASVPSGTETRTIPNPPVTAVVKAAEAHINKTAPPVETEFDMIRTRDVVANKGFKFNKPKQLLAKSNQADVKRLEKIVAIIEDSLPDISDSDRAKVALSFYKYWGSKIIRGEPARMPLNADSFGGTWRDWLGKAYRPATVNASTDPALNLSIAVPVVPMLMQQRNEELEPVV